MRGATVWRLVLVVFAGLAAAPGARAEDFATLLKGQWVVDGGDCTKPGTLVLSGDMLRLTNATGHADLERVFARRATGFATRLVRSAYGARVGTRTVYEFLAPGRISVTEGASGRFSTLVRCPDPLPTDTTPQQLVETIYRRYASPNQVGIPFDSEAALRQFFAPDLADHFVRWMNFSGIMPDGCVGNDDPFVPGFRDGLSADDQGKGPDEVEAGKASVTAPPMPPEAAQAIVHVSVGDLGKSGEITVVLDRTPAGWRISDVIPASGLSFRADMVACSTPGHQPAAPQPEVRTRPHATPKASSRRP